jgi:hypothetical protein
VAGNTKLYSLFKSLQFFYSKYHLKFQFL